jgi:hypothetical protein
MFGGRIRFASVTTDPWLSSVDALFDNGLFLPGLTDGRAQRGPQNDDGKWKVRLREREYDLKTEHDNYEQHLVPLQWVANWFSEEHWATDRTAAQIMGPPKDIWSMYLEIPHPKDRKAMDKGIVKVGLRYQQRKK